MLPNLFTKLLRRFIWIRTIIQGIFVFHRTKRTFSSQIGLLCCPPCSSCPYRNICFLFFSEDVYTTNYIYRKLFTDILGLYYSCCFYYSCLGFQLHSLYLLVNCSKGKAMHYIIISAHLTKQFTHTKS